MSPFFYPIKYVFISKTIMPHFMYRAFGLTIASDFHCQGLPSSSETMSDVTLEVGTIPDFYLGFKNYTVAPGIVFHASPEMLLLCIDKVARYFVSNGNKIIVEPNHNADADLVCLYLYGSAFGALLFQRGVLPLHGSSIVTPKGAVLFVGHSGFGKSTMAGVFHKRGYQILSDDVSAVTSIDDIPHIFPSYPRILLWEDSIAHIGMDSTGLKQAHARENKFQVPVSNSFAEEPSSLHAIYVINPLADVAIEITPLDGFAKIHSLTEHTYRGQFLEGMKLTSRHFSQISAVAAHAHMFRVDRPIDAVRIEEVADCIENNFTNLINGD